MPIYFTNQYSYQIKNEKIILNLGTKGIIGSVTSCSFWALRALLPNLVQGRSKPIATRSIVTHYNGRHPVILRVLHIGSDSTSNHIAISPNHLTKVSINSLVPLHNINLGSVKFFDLIIQHGHIIIVINLIPSSCLLVNSHGPILSRISPITHAPVLIMSKGALVCPALSCHCKFIVPNHLSHVT